MEAKAWAVVTADKINLRSIGPTRRSAIINFLVTERRVMVHNSHTDAQIEDAWLRLKGTAEAVTVLVTVSREH